jgi:hypothetical protein
MTVEIREIPLGGRLRPFLDVVDEVYAGDPSFVRPLDSGVAKALIDRSADWLRSRGLRAIRGPLTLGMAEEVGCLVEGFDTPPMLLMPHHRPYQGGLIERAGLHRVRDLYAWRYAVGDLPARALRGHASIAALPEVRALPVVSSAARGNSNETSCGNT